MRTGGRVLVVTGTRADFGLWMPVLRAATEANLLPRLLVTAMHLDRRFGYTADEVRASGFQIAGEVVSTADGDSRADMSTSLARALDGVTPVIDVERPDWLLVLGDRGEQLAAALAALHVGVRVAHIHGGERTLGAVDDVVRDMISRIAALHLVATDDARDRLVTLGIEPGTIEVTGGPGLDAIAARDTAADRLVLGRYRVRPRSYALVVQHPETVGDGDPEKQIVATLDAIDDVGIAAIAVYPNADSGGRTMVSALNKARARLKGVYASIPHAEFLALLGGASVIVGNSSSAIIEAPMLKVPAVNVGRRQEGRTRGDNVIETVPMTHAIASAIRMAIEPEFRKGLSGRSPYGDGHAAGRIVRSIVSRQEGSQDE